MNSGKTFLVGGAVRDALLGLKAKERDWVVVGSTPGEMLENGFKQVGASFPVFLHPKSGEEYALARTEKKQGHGYHGFSVDFHPGVTLEEDLQRRDLTINAIARDDDGSLVDPYGGQRDLEQRILRHVSGAFVEDPLRVLRVARFAARFSRFGFRVHESTLALMWEITQSGELLHLAAERIWREIELAMQTEKPSVFVRVLRECGALEALLPEVNRLFGVPQPEKYHPEIDTGIHLLMALDAAQNLSKGAANVVFAVLLHDLGKGITPQQELPSHRGHETTGVPLVDAVCSRLKVPNAVHDLSRKVCLLHLRCHRILEARPLSALRLLEKLDAFRQPGLLPDFIAACEADYRGRKGLQDRPYPQGDYLQQVYQAAAGIRARDLDLKGVSGPKVGERLRQARLEAITNVNPTDRR
ncbi:MAG: multifunctional CCA addition/repair protein [Xanthomonadales bacterium]|nr:multifunctional CCA addition/repair protein [Xanthomonadales bacterium]